MSRSIHTLPNELWLHSLKMAHIRRTHIWMFKSNSHLKSYHCSASGGSFWDRPPGCACLFWFQSGRGLDCSTSLPRGLRPIAAEPQSAQGGTMEQSSTWAKICHFTEVGHWSRSSAAFFIFFIYRWLKRCTFAVRTASHFCSANCVFDNYIYTRYIKAQITWIGVLVHIPTSWYEHRAYELSSSHLHPQLSTDAFHKLCFAM